MNSVFCFCSPCKIQDSLEKTPVKDDPHSSVKELEEKIGNYDFENLRKIPLIVTVAGKYRCQFICCSMLATCHVFAFVFKSYNL